MADQDSDNNDTLPGTLMYQEQLYMLIGVDFKTALAPLHQRLTDLEEKITDKHEVIRKNLELVTEYLDSNPRQSQPSAEPLYTT